MNGPHGVVRVLVACLALAASPGPCEGQSVDTGSLSALQARSVGPPETVAEGSRVHAVDVDMAVPFRVYAALAEAGAWAGPSGAWRLDGIRAGDWIRFGRGVATDVLSDPGEPRFAYVVTHSGEVTRYDRRTGEGKGIRPWAPEGERLHFGRTPPLAHDPFRPELVYAGSRFVHRSGERGATWQIISGDLTGGTPDSAVAVTALAPSSVQEEVIWVGTGNGRLHLTRSSGGTWTELTAGLPDGADSGAPITGIHASRHHGGTAFVSVGEWDEVRGESRLYRTGDYGRSWQRLGTGGGLQGVVYAVEQDPRARELLFAGTSRGLHFSLDGGHLWRSLPSSLPNGAVRALELHPRDYDLVVGVDGSGVHVIDDVRPLRALARDSALTGRAVHVFDPPAAYLYHPRAPRPPAAGGEEGFRSRPYGALITYHVGAGASRDSLELVVRDGDGRSVRTLAVPGSPGLHRVSWDLGVNVPEGAPESGPGGLPLLRVLPASYTLRLRAGDGSASEATLRVLPDPRSELTLEERILGREALREAIRLSVVPREAEERLARAESAVQGVLDALPSGAGPETDTLRARGRRLLATARRLREEAGATTRHGALLEALAGSFGPPTESQRIGLLELEETMGALADRVNDFLLGRTSLYNDRLRAAGREPLPDFRQVGRPAVP